MADHSDSLESYLTAGERVVVATHRHWFAIIEPLATATLSILLIGAAYVARVPTGFVQFLLLAWLVAFGRAVLRVWEWSMEWFVATDQRLLLIYGFIIRKVDMLPISKVTDMTFRRSLVGRMFGFGTFVLESAGQDQALSDLHFIPNPNETYLKIVGAIFKTSPDPNDVELEELAEDLDEEGSYWNEDDPTARPSLRDDLARLTRRRGRGAADATTDSFPVVRLDGSPVHEQPRRRFTLREPDYAQTLYSSSDAVQADPLEDEDRGGRGRRRRRRFF